jgi:hypothetical protein
MSAVYNGNFEPDPGDAREVLAFVLCPLSVFAPTGTPEEIEAVGDMLAPAKEEAIRRWQEVNRARKSN